MISYSVFFRVGSSLPPNLHDMAAFQFPLPCETLRHFNLCRDIQKVTCSPFSCNLPSNQRMIRISMDFMPFVMFFCSAFCAFHRGGSKLQPSFAAKNAVGLQDLVCTIRIQQRRKRTFSTLQLTVHLLCMRVSVCNTTAIDDNAIAAASSAGAVINTQTEGVTAPC